MNSKTHRIYKSIFFKFLFIVALPIILLSYSYGHILQLNSNNQIKNLSLIAHKGLSEIEAAYNAQEYIASKIHCVYKNSSTPKSLSRSLKALNNELNTNIKYIIWTKYQPITHTNYDNISVKMTNACKYIYNNHVFGKNRRTIKCTKAEKDTLKSLFGPQFIVEHTDRCYQKKELLLRPDIAGNYPRLWIKADDNMMLIAFVDEQMLNKAHLLKAVLHNLDIQENSIKYGIRSNEISLSSSKEIQNIISLPFSYRIPNKIKNKNNNFILTNYINNQTTSLAIIKDQQVSNRWKLIRVFIIYFLVIGLLTLFIKNNKLFNRKLPFKILLQHKLFGIIVLFNLIPMSIFTLFSNDYLSQLRNTEISAIQKQGVDFFKQTDHSYISEWTRQIQNLTKSIAKLKPSLAKNGITANNVISFLTPQTPKVLKFTLIASSTNRFATTKGIYLHSKLITEIKGLHRSSGYEGFAELGQVMVLMGELFLAHLNNTPISAERAIKLDFIAEALEQTTTLAMVQKFFENNNKISHFGIGEIITPIFTYAFSIDTRLAIDYALFYSWDMWMLKKHYLNRIYSALSRNKLDLKVILMSSYGFQLPKDLQLNNDIIKYSINLKDNTKSRISTIKWKGKEHFIIGFKGLQILDLKFIGLYPCELIDNKINHQKHGFMLFGFLSFLISVAFGLSISRQILLPVKDLKIGINALKNQDLTFKMPQLGQNEFGDIANIINETIADIKELQKTDDFNTKIFSKVGKEIEFGHIQIYGEASVFSKFGKDYLDIFILEENNKVGIIWGQINKIGVASTLLAAFLKSCTLIYKDLLNEPEIFLSNVNKLVKNINEKENEAIISFQYITFDLDSNELDVANAGCQMPIIINSSINNIENCIIGKQTLHKNDNLIAFSPNFSQIKGLKFALVNKINDSPKCFYNELTSGIESQEKLLDIETTGSSSMVIMKVLEDTEKLN